MGLDDILKAAKEMHEAEGRVHSKLREYVNNSLMRTGNYANLKAWMEMTGIAPVEHTVQEAYLSHVQKSEWAKIKELEEVTGIKPSDEVYKELLRPFLAPTY